MSETDAFVLEMHRGIEKGIDDGGFVMDTTSGGGGGPVIDLATGKYTDEAGVEIAQGQ